MASKKWDDLSSSDEENNEHHKEFRHKTKHNNSQPKEAQPVQQETPKPQEKQQEESKEQTQEKPHFNNRKKPLQGKGDMIDEVKKLDELNIGVNIFNCQEGVVAADIYNNFKDITFDKIIKDRQRNGQFTCYFQTKDHCIHFIKVAPRIINGQRFLMRLTKPSKKIQNDEWNEVGAGGRTLQKENKFQKSGFTPSYKQQDRQGKPRTQYNRKEHHNDGFVQPEQKPVQENAQEEDQQKVENEESNHKVFKKEYKDRSKQDYHNHYGKYSKYDKSQQDSGQIRQQGEYKHKIHNSKNERGERVPQKKSSDDFSRNPKIFGKASERSEQQVQHGYNQRHGIKDGIDEKEQKQEEEEWHESGHGQKPPKNNTIDKSQKKGLKYSEW